MHPVVIGGGRVGTAISRMYAPRPAPILRRGETVPDLPRPGADPGPIWVCTTNDALEDVIAATPQGRRGDLVFVQNGMLLPWLRERGLAGNTQVLLYMAADASGAVTDGRKTVAHGGRWAEHAAATLAGGGVACRVEAGWREFQEAVAVKLLWSSIFWVMSAALGETVGEIAENRSEEVAALVAELLPLVDDYIDDVIAADGRGDVTAGGVSVGSPRLEDCEQQQQQQEQQQQQQSLPFPPPAAAQGFSGGVGGVGGEVTCAEEEGPQQQRRKQRVEAVTAELIAYSLAIAAARPSKDMALKEWRWRNGWLLGRRATPLHIDWLRRAGCEEPGVGASTGAVS